MFEFGWLRHLCNPWLARAVKIHALQTDTYMCATQISQMPISATGPEGSTISTAVNMFDIEPLFHAPGHHTLMSRLRFMGALGPVGCSLTLILHSSCRRLWLQAKLEPVGLSQRHLARNLCKPTWTYIRRCILWCENHLSKHAHR